MAITGLTVAWWRGWPPVQLRRAAAWSLQGSCGTCVPLAQLYRKAKAPLAAYCQHTQPRKEATP